MSDIGKYATNNFYRKFYYWRIPWLGYYNSKQAQLLLFYAN